ncbi:ATP-binding protein [Streptomyces sp. S465]|uniref:ATP-binding protein n=1 Tax=Streptomyces sp. S465 TaxID=2979468 RepID=UPI003FCD4348
MRHTMPLGRFPLQCRGASNPWRGAKEVSGVALVVARQVPTSSTMAVPHGPAGVRAARQWLRGDLGRTGVSDSVIDDAVLILSELLSNAWRHGSPWRSGHGGGTVRAAWSVDEDDRVMVEVTDGGGPTRPLPANPSITARGGRGLNIIRSLAEDWGVRDGIGEVTVWALLPADDSFSRHVTISTDLSPALGAELASGLRPSLDANGSRLDANINTTIDTNINADIDTNIDPDFDRELDFADLDELA